MLQTEDFRTRRVRIGSRTFSVGPPTKEVQKFEPLWLPHHTQGPYGMQYVVAIDFLNRLYRLVGACAFRISDTQAMAVELGMDKTDVNRVLPTALARLTEPGWLETFTPGNDNWVRPGAILLNSCR